MQLSELVKLLKHPETNDPLILKENDVFSVNGEHVKTQGNTIYFLDHRKSNVVTSHHKRKSVLRRMFHLFNPPHHSLDFNTFRDSFLDGKELDTLLNNLPENAAILNIGSLSKKLNQHPGIINLDLIDYENVQVVADAHDLPFKDASVDCVILKSVIEHIRNPEQVMKEIYRALKPNGLFYIKVPFLQPFHAIPDDYQRFTISGFTELMKNYETIDFGIAVGPGSTLSWIIREWLAILTSFGNQKLYAAGIIFWGWVTFWIKFTDILFSKNKMAKNLSSAFWGTYKKKKLS